MKNSPKTLCRVKICTYTRITSSRSDVSAKRQTAQVAEDGRDQTDPGSATPFRKNREKLRNNFQKTGNIYGTRVFDEIEFFKILNK